MDDETRDRFDALEALLSRQFDHIGQQFDRIDAQFDAVAGQLAAIVVRLDEQDASHDRLMGKVDRLGTSVGHLTALARAGEEAMTSVDALARRVAKLEAARGDGT